MPIVAGFLKRLGLQLAASPLSGQTAPSGHRLTTVRGAYVTPLLPSGGASVAAVTELNTLNRGAALRGPRGG